ncbi:hypothetical protein C7M61_004699 [Candidozyma pseudohaemuli]|uniref:RING-type E3 ubiquitin transferase n=1 Tax=Candidozyma pseudohaemuli TaxID=418784 RepID=A0A2P7YGZ6_9ASCO|nr:hypothetical protein C7M61_004699 [[Candida] pseudohaemulonii]PSK35241.1 hypothetical protein C7M61_004699 [[Candida] pseudohaemulonii]
MSLTSWQPDSAVTACVVCDTTFTIFNRRHHCRKCGRVVCNLCSSQKVKWFPGSRVLTPSGLVRADGDFYKTCDECVEEIQMIRRALFEPPPEQPQDEETTTQSATVPVQRQESPPLGDLVGLENNDENLCPVCGTNLLKAYVKKTRHEHRDTSHSEYEQYKEFHISDCLVRFDFSGSHQRLLLPPNALLLNVRNRMLVYHVPPLPQPTYEFIDELQKEQELQKEPPVGLVTLELKEKEDFEEECVICLEELRPGDKVGRLECLCVFHYKCIKDWFNKKGYGECPVHFQHH